MSKRIIFMAGRFLVVWLVSLTMILPAGYCSIHFAKNKVIQNHPCDGSPYSGSAEENATCSQLYSNEDYLSEPYSNLLIPIRQISNAYIHAHEGTYTAYHGKLHCPPPNFVI